MDRLICGKKGVQGFMAIKTKTALVMGMYGLDQQPGEALIVMENFAQYLIDQGL
jgi:profilin